MDIDPRLKNVLAAQRYPLLFVTVSGAHLYGFASADSDWDLRGVHVLPPSEVMGLRTPTETIEVARKPQSPDNLDLDLVTHDVRKFMLLMLKKNGYVLEQIYSPLIVYTTPAHEELKRIARGCITRHHAHHYLGFSRTQWDLFAKEDPPRVKPLLYVYRVLLRARGQQGGSHGMTYFQMAGETESPSSRDCPVCGSAEAFGEPGGYEICTRCGWEDDPVQRNNPDFPGGANRLSLTRARRQWESGK